jgi:DnaJ family protein C protein 11
MAKRIEAETPDGLIILVAQYGKIPPSDLNPARFLTAERMQELVNAVRSQFKVLMSLDDEPLPNPEFIDVTIAVQSLVVSSQLHIPGGSSKSQIIGFYDPCFGEEKLLRITYQYKGKVHQVTVGETDSLLIGN